MAVEDAYSLTDAVKKWVSMGKHSNCTKSNAAKRWTGRFLPRGTLDECVT